MTDENHEKWLDDRANMLGTKTLHWSRYVQPSTEWDHDHCLFCFRRFAEPKAGYDDSIEYGYTTADDYNWICKECFNEFKARFGWINQSEVN